MIHIATTDTFFVDSIPCEDTCPICLVTGPTEIGWIGHRCGSCGRTHDPFEPLWPGIVRKRREYLGLTRRQMSDLTGYKASTIKHYEWVWCSEVYFELTKNLINESSLAGSGS